MNNMPDTDVYQDANTYEDLFSYMPWGILTSKLLETIQERTPIKGSLLDMMCGTGYLLDQIAKKRSDISLEGVDSSTEFITYAKNKYTEIIFHKADVLERVTTQKYDVVLVTGGIHHLPYDVQEGFINRIPALLKENGVAIFADPYIGDYTSETERKTAAAQLGYEYLLATVKNNAPASIIKAAVDILECDVMGLEYKSSMTKMELVFRKAFNEVKIYKTWPNTESEYGDYYVICSL